MSVTRSSPRSPELQLTLKIMGGVNRIAALLGIAHPSVSKWNHVPSKRVLQIERIAEGKLTRTQMRPDLYPDERAAA
jgi:DNA-binding transcriptional regulator YdaS (Cro superfamily)